MKENAVAAARPLCRSGTAGPRSTKVPAARGASARPGTQLCSKATLMSSANARRPGPGPALHHPPASSVPPLTYGVLSLADRPGASTEELLLCYTPFGPL